MYLNFKNNLSKAIVLIKSLSLVICFSFLAISSFAQGGQRYDSEKIEAFKVTFFTQKLGLSVDEAKVFWPIYNDYQREQNTLRKAHMQKMISFRKIAEIENLSDTQVQNLINNELNFKQRDLDIEKKYYGKLKSSLPIKTIGKYYRAQETFKRELLNRYKDGRHN